MGATEKNQKGASLNVEYIAKPFEKLNNVHPIIGVTRNINGYISYIYTGLVMKKTLEHNLLLELSLGGAVHDGPLKENRSKKKMRTLGTRLLFHEYAALGYMFTNGMNVTIFIDHISNADFVRPNSGVTNAGIRYGIYL